MTKNLGPLTTTFTPAPACTEVISGIIFTHTDTDGNTTTHKYHTLGPSDTSECYPSSFEVTSAFYSPGRCPSDWSSACGSVYIGTVTETTATCCPFGYTCKQAPDLTDSWSTLMCSSAAETMVNVTVPDDSHQYTKVTQLSHIMINAAAITVRWQQTDFIASETSTSTTPETTSSSPSSSSSIIPAPVSAITSTTSSNTGLNSGERIAVGIGAGLGGFVLLLIAMVLGKMWWGRKETKERPNDVVAHTPEDPEPPKSPVELWYLYQQELETPSNIHEMETMNNRHEISDTAKPAELPSNQ